MHSLLILYLIMKKKMITAVRTGFLLVTLAALTSVSSHSFAQSSDISKGQDHPLIQRFQASRMTGYLQTEWTEAAIPQAKVAKLDGAKTAEWKLIEGKETRLHYLSPVGKTTLEVHRNYRDALLKAGMQINVTCDQKCDDLYRAWRDQAKPFERQLKWDNGHHNGYSHYDAIDNQEGRLIVGSFPANGRTSKTHVVVYNSIAFGGGKKVDPMVSTFIQIIEEKAQPTGQVSVNAEALKQNLDNTGHVSLYGLMFDTGKTELKAESQTQLSELANALKAQNNLNIIVVGHTDNIGSIDSNLSLSQARAQAIVQALIQAGVEKRRLIAKGIANFAPIATNKTEEGRAMNRRVEIVVQ
ncbi:OmpA/MotB domain-containing protein [Undibacterium macrobrachii]|jgi:outer membrane protein OmpA-like peptidoglycan-associated protein|uniref:OmpA/MotB domain-containing protein n=2 Tax=Undibacterium macrobrachii TaxID=1119058 RepID=A0ABQ2XK51_9BURK|nr:OmpA/MotB domain-containing protein [Undibacterium macrobrachii]